MIKRRLASAIRRLAKDASLRTGLWNNLFFNVYPYMFDPEQLVFMIERVKDAAQVPGCFVKAGVAWGATTALLNRTMNQEGLERPYYAIDTLSGFVQEQVRYEIETLGKPAEIAHGFAENRQAWFDKSMRLHEQYVLVSGAEEDGHSVRVRQQAGHEAARDRRVPPVGGGA